MVANIVTVEDLDAFADQLLTKISKLLVQEQNNPQGKWLKSHEVRRLLRISTGTLQQLRLNGKLPYTKIGGILFYQAEDIQKLLNDHKTINGYPVEQEPEPSVPAVAFRTRRARTPKTA